MIRLALIGCGWHSETAHASSLAHYTQNHPREVELSAACDRDIQRANTFCQKYGFLAAYSDMEEMLREEKPEAVVSVLPIEQLLEVGSRLLRYGVPCVLEKPPGVSLAEAEALASVAEVTGTPHLVSLNRRFNPYLNRAIEWAGTIGPLRYVRGQMFRNARRETEFLWGTGIHVVDAMRHIGGDWTTFHRQKLAPAGDATPWYLISIQFASGCVGHVEILPTVGMVEERFELFGDDFRAVVTTLGGEGESVRCWRKGTLEVEEIAPADAPSFLRDGSYEETVAFLRGVRDGTPVRPTLQDVLPALRVCK